MQQSSNKHGQGDLKGISQDIKMLFLIYQNRTTQEIQKINNVEFYQECLIVKLPYLNEGIKEEESHTRTMNLQSTSSSGLPEDLGQRQSLALDALNRSLNSGYSKEYQTMIKRYFNAMTQMKKTEKKMKTQISKIIFFTCLSCIVLVNIMVF